MLREQDLGFYLQLKLCMFQFTGFICSFSYALDLATACVMTWLADERRGWL